jgi:hypothetical protein
MVDGERDQNHRFMKVALNIPAGKYIVRREKE